MSQEMLLLSMMLSLLALNLLLLELGGDVFESFLSSKEQSRQSKSLQQVLTSKQTVG